jgi:hypothetical protein
MAGWDFGSKGDGTTQKVEFAKFSPGITNIRVIGGEPVDRWTHWQPAHSRSINCPGRGCPICEIRAHQKANKEPYTQGVARRFAIWIINRDTGKLELMEQGKNFFEELRDIMLELKGQGKSLSDVDLKVKRRGSAKDDTVYRIDISSEYPLTESDTLLMENAIDLTQYFKPHTPEQILEILNGKPWDEVMKKEEENSTEEEIELK